MPLDGPRRPPANGGPADALVVFVHGYGANGEDLIELAPFIAQVLPGAAFVSPNAPEPVPGYPLGRQWFAIGSIDEKQMGVGARNAAPVFEQFLDEELARTGVSADRLVLVGFSQGAMMTLFVGPRLDTAPAALIGFSGLAAGADSLAEELKHRPPTLLVHGDMDPVVPFGSLAWSAEKLRAVDIPVTTHVSRGLGHGIGPDGLQAAMTHVSQALAMRQTSHSEP